ncbi:MAG TPA: glycosyltransferase family 9 protein [Vicinamibacterales bacterium]|nr:glycosyltransferase family 9 protein [Vicinamibacterales bacterium]
MGPLQIYDRRERALVTAADRLLALGVALTEPLRRRRAPAAPRRILLLRLERIGDLLMVLPAIADLQALAAQAEIDLVVGSWNADLARAIRPIRRVHTLDAAWLARGGHGLGMYSLLRAAWGWRRERYDLVINFEPDARSNLLAASAGAAWTAGYRSGGGGALLDLALDYDPRAHTTDNARRLVTAALGPRDSGAALQAAAINPDAPIAVPPVLTIPAPAQASAARLLGAVDGPLIGIHVSGGRAIKQWPPDRFAEVARRLIDEAGGTIVLTGSRDDRPLVQTMRRELPPDRTIDLAGDIDLLALGAILGRLDVLLTGDTGPMHLAHAVATPIVAVFGPSDPARYAPRGSLDRVVRVDLPCSPCNRIRLPPARCTGHTPDCLRFVNADAVFSAVMSVLSAVRRAPVPLDAPTA